MKKLFIVLLLSMVAIFCKAQIIKDTGALRAYINANIIPNGNNLITGAQMNKVLNGFLYSMPPIWTDSLFMKNDSLFYRKRFSNRFLVRPYKFGDTIIAKAVRTKALLPDTTSEVDFEIDIFPDLQNMTYYAPADSRAMFNWVVANKNIENIKAVIGVGDITNFNTLPEWDTASAQFGLLDAANIPYVAVVGNHDYGNGFNPAPRDATNYLSRFGPSRYTSSTWYKGHYPGSSNENFYVSFEVGRRKFFVLALEFLPRDAVLTWAGNLLDSLQTADPTRDVIITTHAYQSWTGQLANDTTVYSINTYGMTSDNTGQDMWDKLVKKHENIRYVFNGHFIVFDYYNGVQQPSPAKGLTGLIQATGENGNLVNQIFVNYQDDTAGGRGYFMRLKFKPTTNKVDVSFYSAVLNQNDPRMTAYTIDDRSLAIKNSITSTGVISSESEIRTAGSFRSEALNNAQVAYVGNDHRIISNPNMRYIEKEDHGTAAGLYVLPKVTSDTMHIDAQADFNSKAYAVWRTNRTSPTSINIVADLTDTTTSSAPTGVFQIYSGKKYVLPPNFDTRTSFTADANVPQTRSLGACETCPNGRFYTYNEIFLADGATISSNTVGDYQYQSRQQIRGGASSVNRAHTTSLEMGGFVSQLFIVGNVDTLGKFVAFKDMPTTYDQGNAVKEYYSFQTNHGTSKHIRSWGFYSGSSFQRNYFKGLTMIGDSTVANAGSANLFVDGRVRFRNLPTGVKARLLMIDANNDVYSADTTGLMGGGSGGSSLRFGFSGEDDTFTENRAVDGGNAYTMIFDNLAGFKSVVGSLQYDVSDSIRTHGLGILNDTTNKIRVVNPVTGAEAVANWSVVTGGFANTSLSNLSAPTAINTDLLPDTDDTYDIGSASKQWKDLYLTGASIYLGGQKMISSGLIQMPDVADGRLQAGKTAATTMYISGWDVDGVVPRNFITIVSGNIPTMNIDGSTTWNNKTFTLTGNLSISGGNNVTFNTTGTTGVTFPTGGTLLNNTNNLSDVSSASTTRTNLGATTVGANFFTLTNPSAIRFIRINADNTITARTAAELLSDIGAQAAGTYLVAANNLSDVVSAGTSRTNLGSTTVGDNIFTLTNPSAVRFIRINADNTVTARTAAELLSDIGGQASGSYLVSANNLSDVANAGTSRTNLGATTVGANIFTLSNPSAIRFIRINADNTITARSAVQLNQDIDGVFANGFSGGQAISGGTAANEILILRGTESNSGNTGTNANTMVIVGDGAGTTAQIWRNNGQTDFNSNTVTSGVFNSTNIIQDVAIAVGSDADYDIHYRGTSGKLTRLAAGTDGKALTTHSTTSAPTWESYQPLDADLTTLAGLTATTDNFIVSVSSAWASRTPSQVRTTLALVPGTDVEVHDADLTTIAGLTATTDNFMVAVASAWASRTPAQVRTTLGLVIGTNVQAYDADLDTWATITPGTGVGTFLATPTSANLATAITNETGSGALVFGTSPDFTTGATIGSVAIPTISSTNTMTNKRWTARVGTTTSSTTPTINTDNTDVYKLTAQTADITSFTTNLSGTPVDGDVLEIQITGTAARAITWGTSFVASTVALPTTTVTTATLTTVFQYFTTSSYGNNKWVCVNSF